MITDKLTPQEMAAQLERARELMAQGHSEKALLLAMDTLMEVLKQLRESLSALQENLAKLRGQMPSFEEGKPLQGQILPFKKPPRQLH